MSSPKVMDWSFYGTTEYGGEFDLGTVFKITPSGDLTTLHSFSGPGARPRAALIESADGSFYGTTRGSGTGTVFKIDLKGDLTTLHSFSGSDGSGPMAALVEAADGSFYGTTNRGGPNPRFEGGGTVFRIDATGDLTSSTSRPGKRHRPIVASLRRTLNPASSSV